MAKSDSSRGNISLKAIALDTGGTMTDSFIIDEEGSFAVGKALTTGKEESIGILNAIADSLGEWDTTLEKTGFGVEALVYSGTAMLNRLLEREGNDNIGVIVNAGCGLIMQGDFMLENTNIPYH